MGIGQYILLKVFLNSLYWLYKNCPLFKWQSTSWEYSPKYWSDDGFTFIISLYFLFLVNGVTLWRWTKERKNVYFQQNILSLQCFPLLLTHKYYFFQDLRKVLGIFTFRLYNKKGHRSSYTCVQFSSVAQSFLTLCDPMNRSTPGLPVHHQLPEFTETHAHQVGDAIQPSHPLLSPSPPAPNPSSESALRKRWPKYWSFSFSISPSNEHTVLMVI